MFSENVISSCEFCTNCWNNFRNLTAEERDLVNSNRYEASFKPGEIIIKQGSPSSNAIFLLSGLAKVYMEGYSGRNIILDIAEQATLLAGPGVHVNSRYSYSVAAITQIQACFISFDVLRKIINVNPQFASGFIEDLSEKSYKMHQKVYKSHPEKDAWQAGRGAA